MINDDLLIKADRIKELLKSKSATDFEKKCIAKMVGYGHDAASEFVCVRLGDWLENSYLCGPIISGPSTLSTYFDIVIDGRIEYYLKIMDNTHAKSAKFYNNTKKNDEIAPIMMFRLIRFATLILNSVGVKAKKIYQIKGEIPDEYLPKSIFSELPTN